MDGLTDDLILDAVDAIVLDALVSYRACGTTPNLGLGKQQ